MNKLARTWCKKCRMYTQDDMDEHNDKHDNWGYKRIKVDYVDCQNDIHCFKQWWTGDTLFMACKYCPMQYDIATDRAGDSSGASYDKWGGR